MDNLRSGTSGAPSKSPPTGAASLLIRLAIALILGLVIGAVTAFGQGWLRGGFQALANAASPWLLGAFIAGSLLTRPTAGAAAGILTCACEVAGYYLTIDARGATGSTTEIIFWSGCAVVGGPLLGAAGTVWWQASSPTRAAVAGALIPASFLGEALGSYLLRLGYFDDAAVFVAIGVLTFAVTALRTRAWPTATMATLLGTGLTTIVYGPLLAIAGGIAFGARG